MDASHGSGRELAGRMQGHLQSVSACDSKLLKNASAKKSKLVSVEVLPLFCDYGR